MSATRLLVLGIVRGYGRAHGYLVGSDLVSWGADEWANVKWGSIYHALKVLTRDGYLRDFYELPGRTEYELTERGEDEFMKLLRDAVRTPQPRSDFLGAAMSMLPSLRREEAIGLLRERQTILEERRDKAVAQLEGWTYPPHVKELFRVWVSDAEAGVAWTRGIIERLEAGAYPMAGEPGSPGKPGSWPVLANPDDPA